MDLFEHIVEQPLIEPVATVEKPTLPKIKKSPGRKRLDLTNDERRIRNNASRSRYRARNREALTAYHRYYEQWLKSGKTLPKPCLDNFRKK